MTMMKMVMMMIIKMAMMMKKVIMECDGGDNVDEDG